MVGFLLYSAVILMAGMFLQHFLIGLKRRSRDQWMPLNRKRRVL